MNASQMIFTIPTSIPSSSVTTVVDMQEMFGTETCTSKDIGGFTMGKRKRKLNWSEWTVYKFLAEDKEDHQCYNCYYYRPRLCICKKENEKQEPLDWCPWWIWAFTSNKPEDREWQSRS